MDGTPSDADSQSTSTGLAWMTRPFRAILRHSNVVITQNVYIKTVSKDAKAGMAKLETALNDTFVTPKPRIQPIKALCDQSNCGP